MFIHSQVGEKTKKHTEDIYTTNKRFDMIKDSA